MPFYKKNDLIRWFWGESIVLHVDDCLEIIVCATFHINNKEPWQPLCAEEAPRKLQPQPQKLPAFKNMKILVKVVYA